MRDIVITNSKFLNLESNLCLNTFEWMHIQSCQFLHFSKNWFMQVFEICNLFRKVRRRTFFVWVDFLKNPLASQLPTYFHTSNLNLHLLSSKLQLKKKTVFKKYIIRQSFYRLVFLSFLKRFRKCGSPQPHPHETIP